MNYSKMTGWRKEEASDCKKYQASVRKQVKKSISERSIKLFLSKSYLMRDLCVSVLDKTQGSYNDSSILTLNKALQSITNTKIDFSSIIKKNLSLWADKDGYNQVLAYRTPKAILYTARGDYSF